MELIANTTAPRVYTPARIAQIAAANAAGRALRALGLRVISEELIPDDSGTPILFVDLRYARRVPAGMCEASTRQADGRITALFQGVRRQSNKTRCAMTVEFMSGPTLANPAAFDSIDQLRNALHGANKDLVNLFFEHCSLRSSFAELSQLLSDIMSAQLGNDDDALRKHIAAAVERTRFALTDKPATRH